MMPGSQQCQMGPQGYYHQGFGSSPQHMTVDARPPCYGSCVHGNFPPYNAYWPSCYPPQVPYHPCCMNHSGFYPHASYAPSCHNHPPFPVGYQPWYDSEKDAHGKYHCRKCSSQICDSKNGRGVLIEEHEPEIEKGNQGEAVLPVRSTNCPYPIVWIPHEKSRNLKHGSSLGSEGHDQLAAEIRAPENMAIHKSFPKTWNGCFPFDERVMKSLVQNQDKDREKGQHGKNVELPFDISKLKSLFQSHGMKEAQIQKNKEESGQLTSPTFCIPSGGRWEGVEASESRNEDRKKIQNGRTVECPLDISNLKSLLQDQGVKEAQIQNNKGEPSFPIFWIPSHGKREEVEAFESKESSNEGHTLKSIPSDLHVNEGQKTQNEGKEGNFGCYVPTDSEAKRSMRNIPVENHLQEPRNIHVKLLENHLPKPTEPTPKRIAKNEPVENTKKEQSSASQKASRLPPVCLRVDPLPKKRNGGSKSLSVAGRKEESSRAEETKVASPLHSKKAESKTVPEACNVKCDEANKEMKMSEGRLHATGIGKELVDFDSNLHDGSHCEIIRPSETKESSEKPSKKTFTAEEAARIIQSIYRGHDVRRWEPLKKLKEIATVREQMVDVKKRIQALEASTDQHIQEKEIVIVGEMVLNLLLKLDSVQGLHPSIRNYRKSLATELSDIEEKLDSLKKSSAITEEEAVNEHVEITSQMSDSPVNLEHSQLAEENRTVSDPITEKVLLPSPEDHPISVLNITDDQPVAEAEEGTRFVGTLGDLELATDVGIYGAIPTWTTTPEKIGEVETLLSVNPPSAVGNGMTVTNSEEATPELGLNATEVSEAEVKANASDFEGRKGEDNNVIPPEKDAKLSELPVGVIDYETQLLSQDLSTSICDVKTTEMDPETPNQEEPIVDYPSINSQETSESKEEKEQLPETGVIVKDPETGVIVNEQPSGVIVKEPETGVTVKEQPLETEVTVIEQPPETEVIVKELPPERGVSEHEISEETKKLMEENQRFKETMETLVKAGREQLEVISKLTGRVKSLEKKLSRKKRTRLGRRKPCLATQPMTASSSDAVM